MHKTPFREVLNRLLEKNRGALGVLFLDESGEAVDFVCDDFTPYQLRVVGAYVRIYLRQMARFLEDADLGETKLLHITRDDLYIYAMPLPDDYALAFVQRRPAMVAQALRTLGEVGREIRRELFD